ncbi:8-oxo-dGTP diphosphatase [Modestobacter sp. DSM 44400]|uniref:NUDIX hydrolase n=1 Tax=Modestobacter sp. DSM 44400 TaxID=1550230 RepID=UPI000895709E|nr:bifunctional NUDIX hydrolase/histidine phosphatase family protein [Modestobacter sp. DSM 44400]SDX67367.1 8-oxo-dGTP diphosphatase [Modestobacter sp. DSM 44400]
MSTLADPTVVRAAGGVVWRRDTDGRLETALVHRPKYDDWSLPKGKPDAGEHPLETAVREVVEETGLSVVAGRRSVRTRYPVTLRDGRAAPKEVDYWLMHGSGDFVPNDEVDQLCWLGLDDAAGLVSHEHDRAVLADLARTDVPRTPTLLLVRHASAGDRSDFDGPDELRPLDRRGRAQARRLAEVLALFGPVDVLSAPPVRCGQTVAPLAERLRLTVREVPELGEEAFGDDPATGLAVVERLLSNRADGTPGVTIVCSQGGAIPSVLLALGVRWHATAGALWPPSAKGSVWALGRRGGELSADYYRNVGPNPAG